MSGVNTGRGHRRAKILNVISLEITGTVLGRAVKAPDFVDKVDWSRDGVAARRACVDVQA